METPDTSHIQTPFTHTHTELTRLFIRGYTENGSSNLFLGLALTLYSNCSRDSCREPQGIAKEPPLLLLPPPSPPPVSPPLLLWWLIFSPGSRGGVCVFASPLVCTTNYFITCWSSYSLVCLSASLRGVSELKTGSFSGSSGPFKDTRCSRWLQMKSLLHLDAFWVVVEFWSLTSYFRLNINGITKQKLLKPYDMNFVFE